MEKRNRNLLISILFIFFIFFIPYLYRQNRNSDIQKHSLFTIGKIVKFSKTLKSGDYWDYEFKFRGLTFKSSKPTHVNYKVKIGDQFLVNFSSENPNHNKILYQYKLNNDSLDYTDSVWDKIPFSIIQNDLKK